MRAPYRIGQIVPSSNTTMETEIPAMLQARERIFEDRFTFHSARMRMQKVTPEQLAAMDADSLRCASELADARVDVMGYACLVAIMSLGRGYHRTSSKNLMAQARKDKCDAPVVTSAGALIDGLKDLKAQSVSIITPYMKPLTDTVADYIEHEGIRVRDSIALEIADNLDVGRRDPAHLLKDIERLEISGVDAVVLSACVQMPSLPMVKRVEDKLGLPVTTAAICTVRAMLKALSLAPIVPEAGALLSKRYANVGR